MEFRAFTAAKRKDRDRDSLHPQRHTRPSVHADRSTPRLTVDNTNHHLTNLAHLALKNRERGTMLTLLMRMSESNDDTTL
jgi:hypothetical protein